MGNAHSGKFGAINGIGSVRNWNVTESRTAPTIRASNTGGGTARTNGIKKWVGSFAAFGIIPAVMPGETYSFIGYTAPDDDTLDGVGTRYSGTIMVDSIAITWDWKGGNIISNSVNFTGSGALTGTDAGAAVVDETTPVLKEPCGTKISLATDNATFAELTDLTQATLTISAANQDQISSATSCWVARVAGNIDWTLSVTQEKTVLATPVLNTDYAIKIFTDATDFWKLKWGRYHEASNIKVDIESGAIIERTLNFAMQSQVAGVIGNIIKPAGVSPWWGVAD